MFAGVTACGASKVLCASMVFEVSTRPVATFAFTPAPIHRTVAARFGSRFTSATCSFPSVSRAAVTLTEGTLSCRACTSAPDLGRQLRGSLERDVHLEDVIGRRQHHARPSVRIMPAAR